MLLRFGESDGNNPQFNVPIKNGELTPVPAAIDRKWRTVSYQTAGECDFKDGQKTSVTVVDGPTSQGEGGADYSQSFALTINGHIAYANYEYYPGGGDLEGTGAFFKISAIQYDGVHLLECTPNYRNTGFFFESQSGVKNPQCRDVSDRLLPGDGDKYLTPIEQQHLKLLLLKKRLVASLSPFCKKASSSLDHIGSSPFVLLPFASVVPHTAGGDVGGADIDINNDGKTHKVFWISSQNDYFEGSYLVAFIKRPNSVEKFISDMRAGNAIDLGSGSDEDISKPANMALLKKWGATFISLPFSDEGVRYIDNQPFTHAGQTYIYSSSGPDPNEVPSAIISEMRPDNTITRVCTFP